MNFLSILKAIGHTASAIGAGAAVTVLTNPNAVAGVVSPRTASYILAGTTIVNAFAPSLVGVLYKAATPAMPATPAVPSQWVGGTLTPVTPAVTPAPAPAPTPNPTPTATVHIKSTPITPTTPAK